MTLHLLLGLQIFHQMLLLPRMEIWGLEWLRSGILTLLLSSSDVSRLLAMAFNPELMKGDAAVTVYPTSLMSPNPFFLQVFLVYAP